MAFETPAVPGTAPTPATRAVRLALIVDALAQPLWVVELLRDAVVHGLANLVGIGVIVAPAGAAAARVDRMEHAYRTLDKRRYGRGDLPTRLTDLDAVLTGVPRTDVPLVWDPPSAERIRELRPDLAWYLGSAPPVEPWPQIAQWGTIALDPLGGAFGVRALLNGDPATDTVLRRLADGRAPGAVLARARTSTQRISVTVNHAEHVRHVAELVCGVLQRASLCGPSGLAEPGASADTSPGRGVQRPLGVGEVLQLAGRVTSRLVRAAVEERRTIPQWGLAYHLAEDADASPGGVSAPSLNPQQFTELHPPPDRYWADPFPALHEERRYVFYEEHLAGVRDAHLSVAELDATRGLVKQRMVLKRDYHLSFPSVFRWHGAWYMTPETMTECAVQLYRADRFPDEWSYVGDLVTGARFVDPIIACLDGAWWMFVGVIPSGASEATALHLYRAPTPLGPWAPHALNPLAVDVRRARPAGRVYHRAGAYYRPVQDGAPHYGHAMTIHRIDALTPMSFRETPIARITPDWRPELIGTHTLNSDGPLTVLDYLQRAPRAHANVPTTRAGAAS